MNTFVYDIEEIQCTCFQPKPTHRTGLKRFETEHCEKLKNPKRSNKSETKRGDNPNDQLKKSLRRNKPPAPKHQRQNTFLKNEKQVLVKKFVTLPETKKMVFPSNTPIQHSYQSKQVFVQKQDAPIEAYPRNIPQKHLNFQVKTIQLPPSLQSSQKIYSTKASIKSFHSPQKTLESSIKQSFHPPYFEEIDRSFEINRHKFPIYPREIESIVDEQEAELDEISEVINSSWRGFESQKLLKLIKKQNSQRFQHSLILSENLKKQQTERNEILGNSIASFHFN